MAVLRLSGGSKFFSAGFLFTLRTTFAALIALGIAFWMELDSPAWAPLTVWVVAQPTRGESMSKARWRIVGTLGGGVVAFMLSAAAPQAPGLFFLLLALWAGLCTGCATFASNFRAYAWSLAGFTGAIIAVDAASDANRVFSIAVARCSYIMLGIVCELVVAAIFSADPRAGARCDLHELLRNALGRTCDVLESALDNAPETQARAEQRLGDVLALDGRVEFLALEIGPHARVGDHARAALASLGSALARMFGAALQLRGHGRWAGEESPLETLGVSGLFSRARSLVKQIGDDAASSSRLLAEDAPRLCADLALLRLECLAAIPKLVALTLEERASKETQALPAREKEIRPGALPASAALQLSLTALASVLNDFQIAVTQICAVAQEKPADRFRFARAPWHDTVFAVHNGLRAFIGVGLTSYVYEVTAWTQGLPYIVYTAVVCCVFGPRPMSRAATMGYLYGTLAAAGVAFFMVMLALPAVKTYEPMALLLGVALLVSFPARLRPATAGAAATYGFMLMLMCGLDNHRDMNEIQYFNRALGEILASTSAVVLFRVIYPFNLRQAAFRVRRSMLAELHTLSAPKTPPGEARWISHSLDRFSHLVTRTGEAKGDPQAVQRFLYGLLATLALGLNVLRLRRIMRAGVLPPALKPEIERLLKALSARQPDFEEAVRCAQSARKTLVKLALRDLAADCAPEENVPIEEAPSDVSDGTVEQARLQVAYALGCLLGIERLLLENRGFLDPSRPMGEDEEYRGLALL